MISSTLRADWFTVDEGTPPARLASRTADARDDAGFHVAVIMDGNGRWARRRGKPRAAGHVAGTGAIRDTIEAAPALGITTLTMYAFSSDNWRRPRTEVGHLMRLFQKHLDAECDRLIENGIRLSVIGRRDRLPRSLCQEIERVEGRTRGGPSMHVRLAIDYSARDALLNAAILLRTEPVPSRDAFERCIAQAIHASEGPRPVDLLVRTGGEQRLSDFLLWESAYAELLFLDTLWPDFDGDTLASAVRAYRKRERRFGGLPARGGQAGIITSKRRATR